MAGDGWQRAVPIGRMRDDTAQFRKRLEQLEQPHQSPKIVEVILIGQDEPEPPYAPNVEVIRITLDDPSEQAERGR
jgi:hypothetical protein